MHFHCEIILPPDTDDVADAVASVMKPFDENLEDDEERRHPFWDWYQIGGRWAGQKLLAGYDKQRLDEFHKWLTSENVTVSGIRFGKQELNPSSQITKVDEKWNEMFPSSDGVMVACPLFQHSAKIIAGDICPLRDVKDVTCSRVIFTGPSWINETKEHSGPLEAVFMLAESAWNGVNHMDIKWDHTIADALAQYQERLQRYAKDYRSKIQPTDNWLTVTIDYHS